MDRYFPIILSLINYTAINILKQSYQSWCSRASFQPYAGYAVYADPEDHQISRRNLNKVYNWVGMVPDIFEYMADTYNFTYDLFESRDGAWGWYDPEADQWHGIIRDLMDDVADIGPAPLLIKEERTKVVDYLIPFHVDGSTFVISRETAFNNGYTKAFATETWITLVVMVFIVALSLAGVVKYGGEVKSAFFQLDHCFIFTAQNFCGFGAKKWHVTPVNIPARYSTVR